MNSKPETRNLKLTLLSIFGTPWLKWAYIIILFSGAGYYTVVNLGKFLQLLNQTRLEMIGLALLTTVIGIMWFGFTYYSLFRDMGSRISYPQAIKITTFSLLGKYLPGKVLTFGNFYLFSREMDIPTRTIAFSFLLVNLMIILIGLLCGLPLLPILLPSLSYSIILLPVILILALHPKILRWIIIFIWKWIRRYRKESPSIDQPFLEELDRRFYFKITIFVLINFVIGGTAFYFSLAAFVPLPLVGYPLCVFGAALSTTIGFLALFAPAGIGVREGVSVVVLKSIAAPEAVVMAVIASRALMAVVEVGGALTLIILKLAYLTNIFQVKRIDR
ncbi:MAG: lysylphosphatidylglycerol synthase domain-containing protein [bacterium]